MSVSFATDIKPTFQQYQGPMTWRFDLTNYNAVKENARLIQVQINPSSRDVGGLVTMMASPQMPPPGSGYPALSDVFLNTYNEWVEAGCPP